MELIKGNKALAKKLNVHEVTICHWLKDGKIKPHKRINKTIFYNIDNLFVENHITKKRAYN